MDARITLRSSMSLDFQRLLRKCKSLMFGSSIMKKDLIRKRYHSENEAEDDDARRPRRRQVNFADIEELYHRYVGPSLTTESKNELRHCGSITNISYIHRNCAEYINSMDITADEHDETLAADPDVGHLNIVHETEDCIKRQTVKKESFETTFGKKGKGVGEFQDATSITHVSRDRVLVTDMINGRLQCCTRDGTTVAVYGGEEIAEPWSTCVTNDDHIAMTSRNRRVVKVVSREGDVLWSFGSGFFQSPSGVCVDSDGNFIVTDTRSDRVSMHDSKGKFVKYIGNPNIKEQQFRSPRYVCVSPKGDIIVSDSGHHCIKVFDKNGHYLRSIGRFGKKNGEMKSPHGVCTDSYGHILVADHYNNRVSMFTPEGAFVCHVVEEGHGIVHPKGLALCSNLNLYVSVGHLKACSIKVFKLQCTDPTTVVMV